jgi:hypothetical protein
MKAKWITSATANILHYLQTPNGNLIALGLVRNYQRNTGSVGKMVGEASSTASKP